MFLHGGIASNLDKQLDVRLAAPEMRADYLEKPSCHAYQSRQALVKWANRGLCVHSDRELCKTAMCGYARDIHTCRVESHGHVVWSDLHTSGADVVLSSYCGDATLHSTELNGRRSLCHVIRRRSSLYGSALASCMSFPADFRLPHRFDMPLCLHTYPQHMRRWLVAWWQASRVENYVLFFPEQIFSDFAS